jgi:hypothetical protein
MTAEVPQQKRQEISGLLSEAESKRSISKRQALRIIGKLNYLARLVAAGRPYLSKLIALAGRARKLDHFVHLSVAAKQDLRWWQSFLDGSRGTIPLPRAIPLGGDGACKVSTDASGIAYGGILGNEWFSVPVDQAHSQWSINIKEAYAIALAVFSWSTIMTGKTTYLACDNAAIVMVLEKGRSKNAIIDTLIRQVFIRAAIHSITMVPYHLPGQENRAADALSRQDFTSFRKIVPNALASMTEVILPFYSKSCRSCTDQRSDPSPTMQGRRSRTAAGYQGRPKGHPETV